MAGKKDKSVKKTKSKYYHICDGEWIEIPWRGFREQCCDCGLCHELNFRLGPKGELWMQTFRHGKATGGARRPFNFTKEED